MGDGQKRHLELGHLLLSTGLSSSHRNSGPLCVKASLPKSGLLFLLLFSLYLCVCVCVSWNDVFVPCHLPPCDNFGGTLGVQWFWKWEFDMVMLPGWYRCHAHGSLHLNLFLTLLKARCAVTAWIMPASGRSVLLGATVPEEGAEVGVVASVSTH
ncbi:hypothetical protein TRVL_05986 [Trypanosoma vivax]|nr:hypothetical protein TRVL_05986 [Trypanosoma vivax]